VPAGRAGERDVITVVGMDGSPLSPQAEAALASATLVVGGRRHLAALPSLAAAGGVAAGSRGAAGGRGPVRTVVLGELAPALDALAAHEGDAVVLASGDPGFFGIVRALRAGGLAAEVLPAVSSVALAFARAGLSWDDAAVVSAHGRDLRPAVNVCRAHPKVAVLTGPGAGPAQIAAALAGWDRRLVVCEQLGSGAERVTECSPASAVTRTWSDPNVVLVLARPGGSPEHPTPSPPPPGPAPAPGKVIVATTITIESDRRHDDHERKAVDPGRRAWLSQSRPSRGSELTSMRDGGLAAAPGGGWALGEEEFDSRDAVITKAEVRALALARLAPAPGTLVWDVGAGSGSVAVECARFGAAVIAVERDPRRCGLIKANAERHAVDVRVVHGEAPAALDGLPAPDAVFTGGGGQAVIEAVAARHPARLVVALAAVERAGAAHTALTHAGYAVDGALLQASRLAPLPGEVHRLAAMNPVFLLWATRAPAPGQRATSTPPPTPGPAGPAGPPAQAGPS
jgi:precorrin-6B C5,15-methyltransferase / cobalt-precorrin-6B C5,C15-methyltransferase